MNQKLTPPFWRASAAYRKADASKKPVLRTGAGGADIILRPGAGAEIIFIINIFCNQFGGC